MNVHSTATGRSRIGLAVQDLAAGARMRELWGTLGWHDIRQRYRRSVIGPFWITLSMGAMIGGLGILYAGLFRQPVSEYFPYLALGFIVWGLVAALINDGCSSFFNSEAAIKQMPVPLSVHVYRVVWRTFIMFAHNISIYIIVMVVFGIKPNANFVYVIPGLLLIAVNGVALTFLFGILSARFRDIPLIIGNIVQMIFFLTPIIWRPQDLPGRQFIVDLNPFYYFIEIIRQPLLGHPVPAMTWIITIAITGAACTTAFLFFARFRGRIAYWI
jgi:ABC-2 type transport system permease protein